MSTDDDEVTSEIYQPCLSTQTPTLSVHNVVTRFVATKPGRQDEDGDLEVIRRHEATFIDIEHSPKSSLSLVGRQVWRGALLLADLILSRPALFSDRVVLEMGAGVGLTSLVAATIAKKVIATALPEVIALMGASGQEMFSPTANVTQLLTNKYRATLKYLPTVWHWVLREARNQLNVDRGGILQLLEANSRRNAALIRAPLAVLALDFTKPFSAELQTQLAETTVLLAADVVYHDDLTDAFVEALVRVLAIPPNKTLYFALEQRFVFTVADRAALAPCYEHFLKRLAAARLANPWIRAEQVSTDFPQWCHYERNPQLVLWEIRGEPPSGK